MRSNSIVTTLIQTSRLDLRVLDESDAPWILELVGGDDWIRNIGDRGVRTLEDARAYIARMQTRHEAQGFSFYAVLLRETGNGVGGSAAELGGPVGVGICGFASREGFTLPDIGFAFLPRYYRQGFAYESASAVLAYGRATLGFGEVLGITSPENIGSQRVLEKLGLARDPDFVGDPAFEPAFYYRG